MTVPFPDRPLKLGTRRSPLALAQAEEARARLIAAHGWDESRVDLVPVTASGDRIQDRPLAEIGGKALWTKELDAWLVAGEIDFAVHSAKDVETIRPPGIAIAAILPREDVRDVLVGAASIAALAPGACIGTSAPRRAAQLLHARPDCTVVPIRGNVATRLARLAAGEADAYLKVGRAGHRWDACAPEAVARAAGALFTDTRGLRLDYQDGNADTLGHLAAPPALHARLVELLANEPAPQ